MWKWQLVILSLVVLLVFTGLAVGDDSDSPDLPQRIVLENGLTVILAPVPGTGQIAVETLYRTGLTDEPAGMAQASNLMMRLVCQSATKSYQAGEAMDMLNQNGMANAETMLCATHYDYLVSPDTLETALRVEAERLARLRIEKAVVSKELTQMYQEVNSVEQFPEAGMFKFAFAALNQAWRHGETAVWVKSGLKSIAITRLRDYHRSRYQPGNMVLVLVGDFDPADAMVLVKRHLGALPPGQAFQPLPIDWGKIAAKTEVHWDSNVRAVCIAFRPSDSAKDRYLVNLWGWVLAQKLMSDQSLAELTDAVFCADPLWNTGDMPFYIYAAAKKSADVAKVQAAMEACLHSTIAETASGDQMSQLLAMAGQLTATQAPSREMVQAAAEEMISWGVSKEFAEGYVMGNCALQMGLLDLSTSGNAETLDALSKMSSQEAVVRLDQALDSSREIVTVLMPEREDTDD